MPAVNDGSIQTLNLPYRKKQSRMRECSLSFNHIPGTATGSAGGYRWRQLRPNVLM
jgi:hypothetical protein